MTAMVSASSSWSIPLYSARWGSKPRNPPPVTPAVAIARPRPVGGLKRGDRPKRPRLPSMKDRSTVTPIRSTVTVTGPSTKRALILVSVSMPSSPTSMPMWAASSFTGPTACCNGNATWSPPLPENDSPSLLLQRNVRSNGAWTDSRATVPRMKLSASASERSKRSPSSASSTNVSMRVAEEASRPPATENC